MEENAKISKIRLKIEWGRMRPRLATIGQMAAIGVPIAVQNLIQTAVFGVANARIAAYEGRLGVAAIGIVGAVYVLFSFPVEGIVQGAQALWGYNYGAGRLDRVRSVTVLVLAWSTAAGALFTLVIELFPRAIVSLFNTSDPRLLALGAHGLAIFFLGFFLFGLNWAAAQFFQAVGRPAKTALLLLGRNLLLIAGMSMLPRWLALDGVLWAGPASDLLTAVLSGALLAWGLRRLETTAIGCAGVRGGPARRRYWMTTSR